MSAVVPQIVEPVGNAVRVGLETASQLRRNAPARVYYSIGGVGQPVVTIAALTPAIPWTSGFASNANAPTAAATIDMAGAYTPWVVFLVHASGGMFAPGQMYVAKLSDWSTLAGNNTRTLVVLDVYRFHQAEYAGREMLANLQVIQAGMLTGASAISIPGSADTGTLTVTFPQPFNSVPVVVAPSRDKDRPVVVSGESTTGFTLTASQELWRNRPAGASGYVLTILAGNASVVSGHIGYPGSFSYASIDHISCATRDPNYIAEATDIQASYFVITVWYVPLSLQTSGGPSTPNTLDPVGTPSTGNSSISGSGFRSQAHTHNVPSAPPVQTGTDSVDHNHDVLHTHIIAAHQHGMNAHTHGVQIAQPVGVNTAVAVDYEVFGGRGTAITTVDASWIAVGS